MLQGIRDRRQGMAVRVFIGFIIAVFALVGIDSIVGSLTGSPGDVSVNGVNIDEYTVDSETQRKTQEFLSTLGDNIDPSLLDSTLLRASAINDLIQRELLAQAADDSGMRMSSAFLERQIATTPDFQVDGAFNNERATILLQSLGYTGTSYKATLAREGVLNQLLLAYSGSGFATASEVEQIAVLTTQKRDLRYLMINLQSQSGINVDAADIESYYQDNQASFMLEEQIAIEYLEINKDNIFSEIEVSEEQVKAQYDLEITSYQSQIERRASHILLQASDNDSYSSALAEAEQLKVRIDNGDNFETLAAEFSDDTGSAQVGGDIGYTNGASFDEVFETALQALVVGEVSAPVRTDFGIHLIKLTEQSASEFESYDDSKERISRDLLSGQVDNLYLERAEELGNLGFESIDLDDPADILGLTKQRTELFGRSGGVGIAAEGSIITAAFSSDVLLDSLNSELIALGSARSVILRLVEHNLPAVLSLDEVRGEIEVILRTELVKEQVKSIGETIVRNLENNQNIDGLLTAQGLNWNQINQLRRSDTGLNPELVDIIFSLSKPAQDSKSVVSGLQLDSGEYLIIDLQSVTPGSMEELAENEAEGLRAYITQQRASDDYVKLLSGIESRADIRR